jgi:hypothetical protein
MDAQVRKRLIAEVESRFGVTISPVIAGYCFAQAQRIFHSLKASGATLTDANSFEHGEHRWMLDSAVNQVASACRMIDSKTRVG